MVCLCVIRLHIHGDARGRMPTVSAGGSARTTRRLSMRSGVIRDDRLTQCKNQLWYSLSMPEILTVILLCICLLIGCKHQPFTLTSIRLRSCRSWRRCHGWKHLQRKCWCSRWWTGVQIGRAKPLPHPTALRMAFTWRLKRTIVTGHRAKVICQYY